MTEEEKQREYQDADRLRDAAWRWEVYRPAGLTWRHEPCVFCFRRIAEPSYGDPDALAEAWTTTFAQPEGDTGYEWVCPTCFAELRETFRWHVTKPCNLQT